MSNRRRTADDAEVTGSWKEIDPLCLIGPVPAPQEQAAIQLLFRVAIALTSARKADSFPTGGSDWEEFIVAGRAACPDLSVIRPGEEWPVDLLGRVAVLVTEDGSAMLLITDTLRPDTLPETDNEAAYENDTVPVTKYLSVHQDGRSHLGSGGMTEALLALAPKRRTQI